MTETGKQKMREPAQVVQQVEMEPSVSDPGDQYIYCKIGFEEDGDELRFKYVAPTEHYDNAGDLAAFVKKALNGGLPVQLNTPLDIWVGKPSVIIFHLDNAWSWRFRNDGPGVTLKQAFPGTYGNLIHYDDTGAVISDTVEGPDCHILSFRVAKVNGPRPEDEVDQPFNLHVELLRDKFDPMQLVFDPDVKNGGPPPPPNPVLLDMAAATEALERVEA